MKMIDPKGAIDLLRRLLTEMIAYPQELVIQHKAFATSVTITLQAHAADTKCLIGSFANNYRAITTTMLWIGARQGFRVTIPPIREPVTGNADERYTFAANPEWPKVRLMALIHETAHALFDEPISFKVHDDDENYTTTVEIFVSRLQKPGLLVAIGPALETLFDAIGRKNGRILSVCLVPDLAPEQPAVRQPVSARGRFTGEIKR